MPIDGLLGQLEHAVMKIMWRVPSATVRDVYEELLAARSVAYTTVLTVMSNLHAKGLLDKVAEGKAHTFSAALTEREFMERECRRAVSNLLERFGDLAIASFVDQSRSITPETFQRLRELGMSAERPHEPGTSANDATARDDGQ